MNSYLFRDVSSTSSPPPVGGGREGAVDFDARYFDPQLGRWHVPDPANQYPSPYVGMGNNPVNSIDPSGCENIGGWLGIWLMMYGPAYAKLNQWHAENQMTLDAENGRGIAGWYANECPGYGDGGGSGGGGGTGLPTNGNQRSNNFKFVTNGSGTIYWAGDRESMMHDGLVYRTYRGGFGLEVPSNRWITDASSGWSSFDGKTLEVGIKWISERDLFDGDPAGLGDINKNDATGLPEWASKTNLGIGAFTSANGVKTALIDFAGQSASLGKTVTQYLNYSKGLGYIGAGLSATFSIANAVTYYSNGGDDWQVGAKATLDVIMIGVGLFGPFGFGISATYYLLDATGTFGHFGKIKP